MHADKTPAARASLSAAVIIVVVVLLAVIGPPVGVRAQEPRPLTTVRALESVFVDTIAGAEDAVVAISRDAGALVTRGAGGLDPLAPPIGEAVDAEREAFTPLQAGTGVLIADPADAESCLVLTTFHVAFGDGPPDASRGLRVTARLREGSTVELRGLPYAADRRVDLAVLRLQLDEAQVASGDLSMMSLGEADDVRKGQFVVALGNPYALARDGSASASIGIVSNIGRRPQSSPTDGRSRRGESIHDYGTLLTVDLRLQLGGSGGPLLNLQGELIGMTTALAALQGYEKSAGFAIPFDAGTRRVIGQMLRGHEAEYGFLGIAPDGARWMRPDGRTIGAVRAAHVALDSPAHQAGLRTNDLILEINGRRVSDVGDLMRMIGLLGPGASSELLVQRRDETETRAITARLGKWPVFDETDVLSTVPARPAWRGLSVDYPTARQRYLSSDRLEQYRRAVVVTHVEEGSSAAAAGVSAGDFIRAIDGVDVQTPDEFAAAGTGTAGPVELTLWDGRKVQLGS